MEEISGQRGESIGNQTAIKYRSSRAPATGEDDIDSLFFPIPTHPLIISHFSFS